MTLPDGSVASGGKLYFYENETTPPVPKMVYSDPLMTVAHTQPIVLTSSAYLPDIFGEGLYTVVYTDENDVQVWSRDNVGSTEDSSQFEDWSSITRYRQNEIVRGSDGNYYRSIDSNNTGHDPVTSPEYWEQLEFITVWNEFVEYSQGKVVTHNDRIWLSAEDDNLNNEPGTGPEWEDPADMTAAEILARLKTVDGPGSGLDADLLDGQHAADFLLSANLASKAEAQAGTAGKILDAAGGHAMVKKWGLGGAAIPDTDFSDVTDTRFIYAQTAATSDSPADFSVGVNINQTAGQTLGIQIAGRINGSSLFFRGSNLNGNFSSWNELWSTHNLQKVSSPTDTTSDAVPTVGWMGQGVPILLNSGDDLYNLPDLNPGEVAQYKYSSASVPSNPPEESASGYVRRIFHSSSFESLEVYVPDSGRRYTNEMISGSWAGWQEAGSSSITYAGPQEYTSADEDGSGNIAISLDFTGIYKFFTLDFDTTPLITTSGTINITITNLPNTATDDFVKVWHIQFNRAGRKNVVFTLPGSVTESRIGTATYQSGAGDFDLYEIRYVSSDPNRLLFSRIDART